MTSANTAITAVRPRRGSRRWTRWLYFRAMVHEFRWTLLALFLAVSVGSLLYAITPQRDLGGRAPRGITCVYCAWMAMLAQPAFSPPATWYLTVVNGLYPVLGFILIGEGIVRFALLMISRRQGEKEWMRVMASTYRDHIVLCGIGHLGYRVLEHLAAGGTPVVAIERDENGRFVAAAKAMNVPVLIRDMKDDQALVDAGIEHARVVIIATNDDMANLEVALDSRRLNPKIRVVMRLFDQQIAAKISGGLMFDAAFSASALAAPFVAALAQQARALSSIVIGGVPHVTSELPIAPASHMVGRRVDELETAYEMRVLARTPEGGAVQSLLPAATVIQRGDKLAVHCRASQLAAVAAAAQG